MPFIIKPGCAIVLPKKAGGIPHPWVCLTYPTGHDPSKIIIVNITSWREDKDQTTILEPSDHTWITHKSVVYYQDARISPATKFQQASELYETLEFSASVIKRIREGISKSPFTPNDVREFLAYAIGQETT